MQLPIFQTAKEILDYCWNMRRVALHHAVVPVALIVVANLTAWQMGLDTTDFRSPVFAVLNIISAIVFLPFTVTWYRMIILGQVDLNGRPLFKFTRLEGRLLGWQIIIAVIMFATAGGGMLVVGAIVGLIGTASAVAAQALSTALVVILAMAIIAVGCRLSLVLGMAATDRPAVLSEAWGRTKGLGMHMAAIFVLSVLCVFLLLIPMQMVVVIFTSIVGTISESMADSAGVILGTVVGALGSLMILVFPATLFAFVYNRISQSMASDQSDQQGDRTSQTLGYSDDVKATGLQQNDLNDEVDATLKELADYLSDKPKETAADMRVMIDEFFSRFAMPEDVTTEDVDAGGVPSRWVTAAGSDPDRVILYLHGGGFSAGSLTSHQRLAADLSAACSARVLLIDYRLAPEHPFPAGLDDCVTAYRWLLDQEIKPGQLAIAGDSAGGGLAVSTALRLKEDDLDQPAALIALSPWVNMACDGETMDSKAKDDPVTQQAALQRAANDYLNGHDNKDPLVSPVFGDLRGLPPLFIQVGSREVLLDDSRKLAVRARADDVPVRLEEWPGLFHVWHMMADWLTDGRRAIAGIGAFVRRHMG